MKPPETFQTERLLLRKPRLDDAPVIFESYARDPEVTRYLVWKPHKNLNETEQFLYACEQLWQTGKDFAYTIILKGDGSLVGMFGLHPMNRKIEVGYALARPYWGKGYMTETLRTVIDWALKQPGIFRVQAFCDVENIASARVMEKAGMAREGLLRRYVVHPNISDEPRDAYLYAVVK
jgi:[ribosomal protein S5]-alanine N-acetyltransferase